MTRTHALLVSAAIALGGTALGGPAQAGCTVPFTLTTANIGDETNLVLRCFGPWSRTSAPAGVQNDLLRERFYCADQTIFSMWGGWSCQVQDQSNDLATVAEADFCVESTGPAEVDLSYDGGNPGVLGVNPTPDCSGAEANGVLGQNGATAAAARDADHFDFPGRAGETVQIVLDRDGTGGSDGKVATLEVFSRGGGQLAQRTGQLPLRLQVSLADAGIVVAVRQAAAGAGEPFRGAFSLSVRPLSGKIGKRLLSPRANVEP